MKDPIREPLPPPFAHHGCPPFARERKKRSTVPPPPSPREEADWLEPKIRALGYNKSARAHLENIVRLLRLLAEIGEGAK